MAVSTASLQMVKVTSDSPYVSKVARTINLAFAQDPLVKWLRPNAETWEKQTPELCKWQYRRVQRAILEGSVFSGQLIQQNELLKTKSMQKGLTRVSDTEKPLLQKSDAGDDAPIAIMLFPPEGYLKWTISRLLLALKLWIRDSLNEAPDHGTSMQRLEKLMVAHDKSLDRIRTQYRLDDLWYLEVIAVHPRFQSCGMGGKTMRWMLEHLQGKPIVLECTTHSNIAFYERFGFRVVEEVELIDGQSANTENTTTYWVMFRDREVI